MWIIDPAALRRLRAKSVATAEKVALQANVSIRRLRELEQRGGRVRPETIEALAEALGVNKDQLVRVDETADKPPARRGKNAATKAPTPVAAASPAPSAPPETFAASLPPLTETERLVALEQEAGLAETPGPDGVPELRARSLNDIYTLYAAHAGRRYWVPCVVQRQRGVSHVECAALGEKRGAAARFLVERAVVGGHALHLTLFAGAEHATALQTAVGTSVRALVELVVWDEARGEGGFVFFGAKTPRPWAFRVCAVVGEGKRGRKG